MSISSITLKEKRTLGRRLAQPDLILIARIVENCLEPKLKTHIYWALETSSRRFYKLLERAINYGFISQDQENAPLRATEKGKNFLKAWKEVEKFLKEV